jgi:hypothetical protein
MPGLLSVENEIKMFLIKHNLDAARFSTIEGNLLTPTKLSQSFNDFRPLSAPESEAARKTMKAIDQLVEVCAPLPVNLKNPTIVRRLLKALEDNLLSIHIFIRAEDWAKTDKY